MSGAKIFLVKNAKNISERDLTYVGRELVPYFQVGDVETVGLGHLGIHHDPQRPQQVLGVELLLLEPALAVLHVVQRLGGVAQIEQVLDGDVVDGEVLDGRVHGVRVRPRDDLDTVCIVQKLTKSSSVNHLVAEVMMSSLCRQCFVRERQNAIAITILWCLVWYLTLIL